MKNAVLILALALSAAPALAQQTEEDIRANATVLPMIAEMIPGYHGQVVTACIVASALPEEKAQLAAAAGPSPELTPVVNAVLARAETVDCIQSTLGG